MYFKLGDKVKVVYSEEFKNVWGFLPVISELENKTGEIYLPTSDFDVCHSVYWGDGSVSTEAIEHLRLIESTI